MWELVAANWIAFLLVALLAILIAYWIVAQGRKPRERSHRADVLDEGVGPAQRNQALIDAPPAAMPKATAVNMPDGQQPAAPAAIRSAAVEPAQTRAPDVAPESLRPRNTAVTSDAATSSDPHPARVHDQEEGQSQPEPEPQMVAPGQTQAISDREAIAAAIKIHQGAHATDDLSRIKGLGPKLLGMLGSMGISRYDQIAAWSDEDVQKIDAQLGSFAGRIERDNWREQARHLSQNDIEGYENRFGKL
ncbi:hypothetical protein RM533_08280 [Croceicoccus sp. F390]|uniref:Flap endonuclease-1-like 5' DNA nuclease n=1 Tax=Croceicoccus esteveae TaxID=3075597 RepID=A0ABU2ZII2_9SPHN|nr:hypothetical protein [Croceicoccus sp. F390]MDT0576181.1 hypothetical protein [Croceicoccus sp. F390]